MSREQKLHNLVNSARQWVLDNEGRLARIAPQIGVHYNTLYRFGWGWNPSISTLLLILKYMDNHYYENDTDSPEPPDNSPSDGSTAKRPAHHGG